MKAPSELLLTFNFELHEWTQFLLLFRAETCALFCWEITEMGDALK